MLEHIMAAATTDAAEGMEWWVYLVGLMITAVPGSLAALYANRGRRETATMKADMASGAFSHPTDVRAFEQLRAEVRGFVPKAEQAIQLAKQVAEVQIAHGAKLDAHLADHPQAIDPAIADLARRLAQS